jgi:carboxymethylenebutenolidase
MRMFRRTVGNFSSIACLSQATGWQDVWCCPDRNWGRKPWLRMTRLETQRIKFPADGSEMQASPARPKEREKLPVVTVIHEIFGLNAHIEDVSTAYGLGGLSRNRPGCPVPGGRTAANSDEIMGKMRPLDSAATVRNFTASVRYLSTQPQTTGNVACTGFCWGGGWRIKWR